MFVPFALAFAEEPATPAPTTPSEPVALPVLVPLEDLTIRRHARVTPEDYPEQAEGRRATRCVVTLWVDEWGDTRDVTPNAECPWPYHVSARRVGLQYVFEPHEVAGVRVPFRTELALQYKPAE